MNITSLTTIAPIDGRYANKTADLQKFFSESGLIKYRVMIEIEYFIALCNTNIVQLRDFPSNKYSSLRKLYLNFNESDAQKVKDIESITNHDVKAVEYFLKEEFDKLGLQKLDRWILQIAYAKSVMNSGYLPQHYVESPYGRLYGKNGTECIQIIPNRLLKYFLYKAWDYDICACGVTILSQMAKKIDSNLKRIMHD